jgi:hypothetical protein
MATSPYGQAIIPKDPTTVVEFPLDKGMVRNVPPTQVPPGAFTYVANYMAGLGGLVRRVGISQASAGTVAWPPVQDIVTIWGTQGTLKVLVIDQKFIYTMGATTMTARYSTYTSKCGVGLSASSTLTFNGGALSLPAKDLRAGDTLYAYSGAVVLLAEREIKTLTSNLVTLTGGALSVNLAGKTFDIRRAFAAKSPLFVDSAIIPGGKIVFSDGVRRLYAYDATADSYGLYSAGTSCNFIADCVTTHKDRIYVGAISTPGPFAPTTVNKQRMLWSQALDKTNFGPGQSQYLDLPYLPGKLKRILTLGQLLVAYFDDALYVGQPTNYSGNTLPYAFLRLDTGGVGLAGMKAVVPWMNGHFFVGDDDIYYLGSSLQLERIGTAIARDYVRYQANRAGAYAVADPLHSRILFGIPDVTGTFSRILAFDYISKAWSVDEFTTLSFLARKDLIFSETWDSILTVPPYTWDTGMGIYPAWDQISQSAGFAPPVYTGQLNKVFFYDENARVDGGNVPIATTLVTGARNEDLAGHNKTWLEFRLKLDRVCSVDVTFTVEGSKDGGVTWTALSSRLLTIKAGYDEGQMQFRFTNDVAMFRAKSNTVVEQYAVQAFTVSFADRGHRIRFAGNE